MWETFRDLYLDVICCAFVLVFFALGCIIAEKRNGTIALMLHFIQVGGQEL